MTSRPRPPPVALARLRGVLEECGIRPLRRHGQHFMIDPNLLASVAAAGGAGPGDTVLEVGPGPGLLTRHLLATGARVVAVEIDPRMQAAARRIVEPDLQGRLTWIESDALHGTHALARPLLDVLPDCTRLVANLPYNIASPLLANLLGRPRALPCMVVTVQREAAARLLSGPGGRDYGPLAVLAGLCCRGRILRRIPPAAFWPRPRVDSALIELLEREGRPETLDFKALASFLPAAFHNRRKTLLNSLAEASGLGASRIATELGLQQKFQKWRAEAFEPVQLCALAHRWASCASSGRNRS